MFFRHPTNSESLPAKHRLNRCFDSRPLFQHCFATRCPDVVQIDVDGQSGDIEDKEVQGCSAFENQSSFKVGMLTNSFEDSQQLNSLFQHVGSELGRVSLGRQLLGRYLHRTSPHDLLSTSLGTTRFQSDTRLPECRWLRSR